MPLSFMKWDPGRFRPEIQPLTILYIIIFFDRERTPLLYTLLISGTVPLSRSSSENFLSLLTAVKAFPFKYELNHENRKFSRLFHSKKIFCSPLKSFYRSKWQTFLSYTSASEIPVLEDGERYPFRAEPLPTGHYKEYSPRPQERD